MICLIALSRVVVIGLFFRVGVVMTIICVVFMLSYLVVFLRVLDVLDVDVGLFAGEERSEEPHQQVLLS